MIRDETYTTIHWRRGEPARTVLPLTALTTPPAREPAPVGDECDTPSIFGHPLTGLPGAA